MSESNFFPENAAESILSPASGTAPEAISSPLSASAASISESFSDVPIPVSGRPGTSVHDAGSFSNTIYFQLNTSRYQLEEAVRVGSYAMKYRHYHATYEIYYLMEGQRYYFIDRSVFSVRPGSLVFVRKNRIHKTSQAEGDRHRRLLIEIDAACMDRWLSEMAGGKLSALFHDDQCVLTLTADQRAVLEAKLNEIRLEAEKKEEGWEEMVEYLLRQILLFSFRVKTSGTIASESAARESISPFPDSEKIRTVNRVAGYLADHYWEQTSLDELSPAMYGIPEPPEENECYVPSPFLNDICIVPAVCFDRHGYRIGYGKGYYDRFLAGFGGTSVGFTLDCLLKDAVPRGRYDRAVDMIITEKGAVVPK